MTPRTRIKNASRFVFVASFLFFSWTVLNAVDRLTGANLFREPVLQLDLTRIDLGTVMPNSVVPCVLNVRNGGGGKLVISAVRGTCDACIRVRSWPMEPLQPNEQSKITFDVSTNANEGAVERRVLIVSNDWGSPSRVVKCSWTIMPESRSSSD